jgi:hypothetical protein
MLLEEAVAVVAFTPYSQLVVVAELLGLDRAESMV